MTLEEHPGVVGCLFPELRRHIVVGADQFRDARSVREPDADGMLSLLTTPCQAQMGRRVRVAEIEVPVACLLEMDRGPAFVFLNLPDDLQFRESCQCFGHGEASLRVGLYQAFRTADRTVLRLRIATTAP